MASEAPVYDLVLLLDTTIEQERRDTILANVEDAIDRGGEIVGRHDWGDRHTVYEVRKHTEADYHLIQFRGAVHAARAAGPQPQDHGRHPALPDHQAPARHPAAAGPPARGDGGRRRRRAPEADELESSAVRRHVASRSARRRFLRRICQEIVAICDSTAVTAGPTPRLGHHRASAKTEQSKGALRGRHQHQPSRPHGQSHP